MNNGFMEIKLPGGLVTKVDTADYDWLNRWRWYARESGNCASVYVVRNERVPGCRGKWRTIRMHRLIMNCPDDMEVHHKNDDTFDNRRCNLEVCTRAENMRHNWEKRRKAKLQHVST